MPYLEAADRADTFTAHAFEERLVDLGEVRMNHVVTGDPAAPALLLIPGQGMSWWDYEPVLPRLAEHFCVHAVDLRGQGRSTWTPGRYTLDNFGNDLVRFIDLVVGRETIVSGLSSGGVLAAWLSAFAKPGQIRAAVWEDPPLFASETTPAVGPSIRQAVGPMFAVMHRWLGDQWSVGDVAGMQRAFATELSPEMLEAMARMSGQGAGAPPDAAVQSMREYDPEWARAFAGGTVAASCDHAAMLTHVRVPVLFTHHFRAVDDRTGRLAGASSDLQAAHACDLVRAAGAPIDYRSFPEMPHSMHGADPDLFVDTVVDWVTNLPDSAA
ncbi:alpha/beta hydrolase [Actinomycetospora aeridis]|uniref:Alpha/beta hydrolase n=1 Tax=Actinomycetospora aeridis TaxID=3129231 RepID=A0ABU8NAL3_9PSEU